MKNHSYQPNAKSLQFSRAGKGSANINPSNYIKNLGKHFSVRNSRFHQN